MLMNNLKRALCLGQCFGIISIYVQIIKSLKKSVFVTFASSELSRSKIHNIVGYVVFQVEKKEDWSKFKNDWRTIEGKVKILKCKLPPPYQEI